MKIIRHSNEDEVVLNFLVGELESVRFSEKLKQTINELNLDETIITNANLNNKEENSLRKELLGRYRGFKKNSKLFENLNKIKGFFLCDFSLGDLKNIYYLNYSYWNELSNNTASPLEASKNIFSSKKIYKVSNKPFLNGLKDLEKGKTFLPMIFLTYNFKSFVVLEGNSRITLYALSPQHFKNINTYVLKCSKKELKKWSGEEQT